MSHTSTLLRSRKNGAIHSSSSTSSADRHNKTKSMSLPLHSNGGTSLASWRGNGHASKIPGSISTVLLLIILMTCLMAGLCTFHTMKGTITWRIRSLTSKDETTWVKTEGPIHDIVIAGAGPAGLTAALFGARAGLDVIVLGSETGLLSETQHLDNFPSYSKGNGPQWLKETKQQALSFGAKFATPGVLATEVKKEFVGGPFALTTTSSKSREQQIHAWSVVIASGATPRHLGLANENLMWGKSLHNCAICDGHLYMDKTVLVVGGGDSAVDATILLARYAKKVFLVHRGTKFSGKNQAAIDVAESTINIEIVRPFVVKQWELDSEHQLVGARIENSQDSTEQRITATDGAFVMIGATPNTDWLKGTVDLDSEGLVKLDGATRASIPGIYAVGEVSDNIYKQAITASASGAQAAIDAERWLRETRGVHKHVNAPPPIKAQASARAAVEQTQPEEGGKDNDSCDLTTESCIVHIVKQHPVVVFSKSWCPYCRKALEALSAAGVSDPYIIDLSKNSQARKVQTTLKGMTGRMTVPNVFVGGKSIGGGDETASLQSRGELVPLLVEAGALETSSDSKQAKGESCDLREQSCIEEIIMKYPVLMFTLEWCPECKRTLELLRSIGAETPHLIDLDNYKPIQQEIRYHMLTLNGRRSVPNLYIGGEFFGGYRQTLNMHQEGKLLAKLKEVGWPVANS